MDTFGEDDGARSDILVVVDGDFPLWLNHLEEDLLEELRNVHHARGSG